MITDVQANDVVGQTVYGDDHEKIGKVGQLYLDDETGAPEFVTVNTGLFGTKETFVPVEGADLNENGLTVPFSKEKVKGAPSMDVDGHLDHDGERELFEYYGLSGGTTTDAPASQGVEGNSSGEVAQAEVATDQTELVQPDSTSYATTDSTVDHASGHDTSGPTTDEAMTRSEERLRVGTTSQEAGRARLRKYVTTEMETRTVPVRKERAVLETEPITDANRGQAEDGPGISEEEHEVVLHEEVPVVEKTVEAVERVRLGTETVTEEETVSEELRSEHIEAEGDVDQPVDGTTPR